MPLKDPVVATCPECDRSNLLICKACGYCAKCADHTHCNTVSIHEEIDHNEFILVESGTFMMGEDNDPDCPSHQVTLSTFYIGKFQVTQKEWLRVMGNNPSKYKGDNLPVDSVSWYDVLEYCNKRSLDEDLTPCYLIDGNETICNWLADGYRLPTEAEWEFAARGGNQSQHFEFAGSNILGEVAWYAANSREKTHAVGTKKPNELGIYDMSGNVWEWCWDWWSNTYVTSPQFDPKGISTGTYRVHRGGGWSGNEARCKITRRFDSGPDGSLDRIGFRLVKIKH